MKSAYELAIERLNKTNPQNAPAKLTAEKKKRLAEVDKIYQAKIAEKDLFFKPKIEEARFGDDAEALASLEKQFRDEVQKLREEMESEKEKVRNS
jgi:hypothetical protein